MRAAIVDTSRYQGQVNAAPIKAAGFCGIISRCTIGGRYDGSAVGLKLEYYLRAQQQAREHGLIFGGYHVLWPANNARVDEARHYMANAGRTDLDVLDVELMGGLSPAAVLGQAERWCNEVGMARGRAPLVYTGSWFWDGPGYLGPATPAGWEHRYGLIEAEYTRQLPRGGVLPDQAPTGEPGDLSDGFGGWKFWQWTSSGRPFGVQSQSLDYSIFNGTEEELRAYLELGPKPVPMEEKVERLWGAHPDLHP
jgi:GH25 family lysozyme M1 (1,4-beta-N-acetylmuramidase)